MTAAEARTMTLRYEREYTFQGGRTAHTAVEIDAARAVAGRPASAWRFDVSAEWLPPGTVTTYALGGTANAVEAREVADQLATAAFDAYTAIAGAADTFRSAAGRLGLS